MFREVVCNTNSCGDICSHCHGTIDSDDGYITFDPDIKWCCSCSVMIIGSLIQDYAKALSSSGTEYWVGIHPERTRRIAAACEVVTNRLNSWAEVFESMRS